METEAADEKLREARRAMDEGRHRRRLRCAPPGGYDPVVTNAGEADPADGQAADPGRGLPGGDRPRPIDRDARRGRFRVAEKDLEVDAQPLRRMAGGRQRDAVRRNGLERLRRYRTSLESRKASGQGIAADVLKTEVRLASDEADAIDAESRRAEAAVELDVLMGVPPDTPLMLAPSPVPTPSATAAADPGEPEVPPALERAAEADVRAARAERRLHLSASADMGWWGADTTNWSGDRWRRDAGYSLGMQVSWLLWDFGASDARIARAKLEARSAHLEIASRRREAELQRAKAATTAEALARQIDVLSRAEPSARDAYLDAESRYRGGAATSLEDRRLRGVGRRLRQTRPGDFAPPDRAGPRAPLGDSMRRRAAVAALLLLAACGGRKKADDPGKEKESAAARPATPVKAAPVSRITLFEIVSAPGKVTAMTQAKVRAPFAGTLTELRVTDGDPVSAGQIIGSIVARDSEAALSGAREMERQASTDSERGDAARARALAEKNIVRAPLKVASDGVVESHAASAGDRVSEGEEIVAVAEGRSLVVIADVPQLELPKIRPGEAVTIEVAGRPPLPGTLHDVLPGGPGSDLTVPVRIDFGAAPRALPVGLFATARIRVAEHADALTVPDAAILRDDITGSARVALVGADGKAYWVAVTPGLSQGGRTEITAPALPPEARGSPPGRWDFPTEPGRRLSMILARSCASAAPRSSSASPCWPAPAWSPRSALRRRSFPR